jgi:hypothetical protein
MFRGDDEIRGNYVKAKFGVEDHIVGLERAYLLTVAVARFWE